PNSPSYLSSEGMTRMNAYAHGGFDVLCEHFSDRPRSIETFIRKYCKVISDLKVPEPSMRTIAVEKVQTASAATSEA
ncbi:MAG: hypothetical protein WBA24_14485, partial [Geitlerinemataceae cyanobacterium]